MTSTYDFWLSALELAGDYGILDRAQLASLGVHEDEPQPGFWRVPFTADSDTAFVAIWNDGSRLRAMWDNVEANPFDCWLACCRSPISEERYRRAERARFEHMQLGIFGTRSAACG